MNKYQDIKGYEFHLNSETLKTIIAKNDLLNIRFSENDKWTEGQNVKVKYANDFLKADGLFTVKLGPDYIFKFPNTDKCLCIMDKKPFHIEVYSTL